jgi:hypothetical protein
MSFYPSVPGWGLPIWIGISLYRLFCRANIERSTEEAEKHKGKNHDTPFFLPTSSGNSPCFRIFWMTR